MLFSLYPVAHQATTPAYLFDTPGDYPITLTDLADLHRDIMNSELTS